jgi:UDP-N-acetylmuramyl pentapeptide phosphotransferase/UDP-N-acetylglucosamine-1-phosphate transferase
MTLNPLQKYLPQLVAAGIAALALDRHVVIEIPGSHVQVGGELSTLLIVLWIVAIINFVNFMDGLDGLVAGTSAVIAITASLLTVQANFWVPVLAASLIGFLAWNASPASIFMGDGGSQFIGYSLAVAVLLVPQHDANLTIGAVLLSPFLVDTTYTLVKRAIARKNLLQAHREHVYQRLAQGAVTHRSMSNFHYVIGAFSGAAAVLLVDRQGAGRWIGAGLLAAFYVAYILIAELVDSGRSPETRRQAR